MNITSKTVEKNGMTTIKEVDSINIKPLKSSSNKENAKTR
jgi:hypothetical protein